MVEFVVGRPKALLSLKGKHISLSKGEYCSRERQDSQSGLRESLWAQN